MSGESLEVLYARLDERLKSILTEMEEARKSRKNQYEQMEEFGKSLTSINGRVASVESSLAKSAPTIEEFITIKHKVVGAGVMGKWAWVVGSAIISYLFATREAWLKWLSSSN